ncbi:alpha/beta hydrolase family protein [Actinokineospora sp.]|uniref:alpha/beta hydrolase family protein n=1 Tax=Actinokineospora sp. TaxID=1872133 RepID=UPI00403780BA
MTDTRDVLTRRTPAPAMTLSYGPLADHVADLRLPSTKDPAPLLLLWHGGFWRAKHDRTVIAPMAAGLAERGFAVASVEFRRTGGGGGWPATFVDVAAAADRLPALVEYAVPGRVDRTRLVYAGHSAGGHLAIWAALRDRLDVGAPGRTAHRPRVAGVFAVAPLLDLAEAHRLGLGEDAVDAFLGGGPEHVPDRYAAADLTRLGTPAVPTVLVHGDQDQRVPVEQSRRYRDRTGVPLVEVPGADHFAVIDPESPAWPAVVAALLDPKPLVGAPLA